MNEFQYLELKGMPFFKSQRFDLSQKGVSLILGLNLDSSNHNTNGCGKSMFFSQFPEIMNGEPVIGLKKEFTRKGSMAFGVKRGGHMYDVIRSFKPSEKLAIYRDGVDLEYRELSAAKAKLKDIVPFNREEVLSLLYLDSRVPHPLIRGDSTQRKNFFTHFFRMNTAPVMRKVVKAELDALGTKSGAYSVHKSRLSELRTKLKDKNIEELEAKQTRLKAKLVKLEAVAKSFAALERVKEDYLQNKDDYAALVALNVSTWKEAQAEAEVLDTKITRIAEQLSEWKAYSAWEDGQLEMKERKRESKQALRKYPNLAELSGEKMTAMVKEKIAEIEAMDVKMSKLQAEMREFSESREDDMKRDLKAAKSKMKELETASGECPTCGAAYDNKHAKKEMRTLDGRITDIQVHLEELLEKRAALAPKSNKMIDQYAVLEADLDTLRTVRKLILERESWEEQEPVKQPKVARDTLIERRVALKEKYNTLLGSKNVFYAVEAWKALSPEDKALLKTEPPTDQLMKTHEALAELKVVLEDIRELSEEKEKLTKTVADLKLELDEKPVLDLLYEGLSRKGAEQLMINLVCDRLEQQVNKYARLLFPEDFRFSFDLNTQFNITVDRKYGKKVVTSDVRKLSGAESLLFSLILMISLLSFVPAKNRCNLLILDEPTSNFSPEMIDAFVKFLPILNSVIPHIIVITPMPNNVYSGAKVYTMVKKGGQSRIIEGHYKKGATNDSRSGGCTPSVSAGRKASVRSSRGEARTSAA